MGQTLRQKEIIQEALLLIAENGMEELTYRNLSDRMGITIPAFYRHYPSKADILLGIIDHFEEVGSLSFLEAGVQGTDPMDKLRRTVLGHARLFAEQSGLVAVLFPEEIGGRRREVHQAVLRVMKGNRQKIAALFREAAEAGLIRADVSPERLAFFLMASLRLSVTLWRLGEKQTDLVAEVAELWEQLRRLLADPGKQSVA